VKFGVHISTSWVTRNSTVAFSLVIFIVLTQSKLQLFRNTHLYKISASFINISIFTLFNTIMAKEINHNFIFSRFVNTISKDSSNIITRFKVNTSLDTLILFNEDTTTFTASVCMEEIPNHILVNMVSTNQFLAFPRISSQNIMESK